MVIILIIVLFVVLGGSGGPKGVVEDFIDADSCSDAEDLVTDDFKESFGECTDEQLESFDGGDEGDFDLEVKDEKIDGDKATVDVEIVRQLRRRGLRGDDHVQPGQGRRRLVDRQHRLTERMPVSLWATGRG